MRANLLAGLPDTGVRFGNPFAPIGQFAQDSLKQIGQEKDRTYQKERDAVADAKAAEMMQMAKAQEARAVADDTMKRSTREAYGKADTLLGAPGMLASQAAAINSDKLLLEAQKIADRSTLLTNPDGTTSPVYAKGDEKRFDDIQAKLGAAAQAAIAKNDSTLEGKRALLMEQAPVSELYTVDPTTQEVKTLSDVDVSDQLKLKEARIRDIDTKIAARDAILNAKEMQQAGFRHAEGMADIANKRAIALTKATAADKFKPIVMEIPSGKGFKLVTANTPAQLKFYENQGATPGRTIADPRLTNEGKSGATGDFTGYGTGTGGRWLGGTSDEDLNAQFANISAMPKFANVPKSVLSAWAKKSSASGFGDKILLKDLEEELKTYGK